MARRGATFEGMDAGLPRAAVSPSPFDALLRPLHRWVWRDRDRRVRKLLRFAETEADGGRDLSRASEQTRDPRLRRLFLRHAQDELRHAGLFRARARELLRGGPLRGGFDADFFAPGERGLDGIEVGGDDRALLAFLHLSEKAAAGRFALYRGVLEHDPQTARVFSDVLQDEAFHMTYTHEQLRRIAPRAGLRLWQARLARLWRAWLRLGTALANAVGTLVLAAQYFVLLPPFALLARRAQHREPRGFAKSRPDPGLTSQY